MCWKSAAKGGDVEGDAQGWSWVQDTAVAVGFLPHSLSLLLNSAGSVVCCVLTWLGQAALRELVFITAAFFITELPHNNFFPPAFFFIILSGKLILVFNSWVHWMFVFSSCWALSILKFSTGILCVPFLLSDNCWLVAFCSFLFFSWKSPSSEKQIIISAWSISEAHCWGIAWFTSLASLL